MLGTEIKLLLVCATCIVLKNIIDADIRYDFDEIKWNEAPVKYDCFMLLRAYHFEVLLGATETATKCLKFQEKTFSVAREPS